MNLKKIISFLSILFLVFITNSTLQAQEKGPLMMKQELGYTLGGGVFMNVKVNNLISKIKNLKKLFIMPTSGDESLSMGAALHCYYEKTKDKEFYKSYLGNLYLGKDYSEIEENVKDVLWW